MYGDSGVPAELIIERTGAKLSRTAPGWSPGPSLWRRLINKEKELPRYLITYLGGNKPSSPEEGEQHMAKYRAWLSSLGDSAVSPANPLKNTNTVNPDGTVTSASTTSMSGFTIVEADSMDAALLIAKACPFLEVGGSLEVSELMQMPG